MKINLTSMNNIFFIHKLEKNRIANLYLRIKKYIHYSIKKTL